VKANIRSVFKDFSALFFPNHCLGCSGALVKGEEILCTGCILSLPRTNYPLKEENPIKDKFTGRLAIKYAWAYLKFRKTGVVQHLLHQLKYNNHPEVGVRLGKLMGKELFVNGLNEQFDEIVPMPLHQQRERKRGYNQSVKIAEGISEQIGVNVSSNMVFRKTNTATQTKKSRAERWENVAEVFEVRDEPSVRGKRILLVDDVITTGASLEACGQQFLNCGCAEISIVCVAEAQ